MIKRIILNCVATFVMFFLMMTVIGAVGEVYKLVSVRKKGDFTKSIAAWESCKQLDVELKAFKVSDERRRKIVNSYWNSLMKLYGIK